MPGKSAKQLRSEFGLRIAVLNTLSCDITFRACCAHHELTQKPMTAAELDAHIRLHEEEELDADRRSL